MSKGGVLLLSYPMYTRMVGEIDVAKVIYHHVNFPAKKKNHKNK